MNIVAAIQRGQDRAALQPEFNEKVEIITCLLRAKEVVPYRRSTQNGHRHHELASAIALAHELNTTLDIRHRSAGMYHADGVTTLIPTYLKRCIEIGILAADNALNVPHGKLRVTNLVERFIA
jgi:ubiquinone biosynthesis protein COQ9